MNFNITMYPNQLLIVQLFGELDHHETEKIRSDISNAILQGDVRLLVWNLEHLQFMDSSGIGLVLGRMRELRAVDGQTMLLNPSSTMQKIFQFSGLSKYISFGTEEQVILQARGIVNG
jgi:stage II sporulation protein AA (anti-sigma F factor antagonist)